jgi:hypothetical protein
VGVFLAAITKCLVLNEEFNFGTESMVSIRNIMKKELETKKIEAVFLDKRRGLGLLPAPINWDTQYQKKPRKSCSNSLSTIKNESNQKTMTNEVESGNIIRLKPRTDKPEDKAINQHVNSISNENVKSSEEKIISTQCFTFDNFGVDTVFETNGIDTVCIGCLKQFKRIIAHLQKSKKCMEKVEFDNFSNAMREIKKDIKNEKDRLRRLSKPNAEKEIERENEAKRLKIYRELKSTIEKETEKENAVKRMKICRGLKCNVKKETEKENAVKRMKICRGLKSNVEKETEKENAVKRMKLYRKRKREEDPDRFLEENRNQVRHFREDEKKGIGRIERLRRFRHAVKYGAIFVCSSCHQRLFENGVTLITERFKQEIEIRNPGNYDNSVEEIKQHIKKKPGAYICHTCKETLKKGKMPCMSIKN